MHRKYCMSCVILCNCVVNCLDIFCCQSWSFTPCLVISFLLFCLFFMLLPMLYLCMLYIFIFFFLYLMVNKAEFTDGRRAARVCRRVCRSGADPSTWARPSSCSTGRRPSGRRQSTRRCSSTSRRWQRRDGRYSGTRSFSWSRRSSTPTSANRRTTLLRRSTTSTSVISDPNVTNSRPAAACSQMVPRICTT